MDVFELSARLTVDTGAYDAGLADASRSALIAGEVMSTAFGEAQARTSSAAAELAEALRTAARQSAGELGAAASAAEDMAFRVTDAFLGLAGSAADWGADLVSAFTAGIESRAQSLRSAAESLAGIVRGYLHFSEPDVGPLADFHTYAPDMMELFARGVRDGAPLVTAELERAFARVPEAAGFDFGLASVPAPRAFARVPEAAGFDFGLASVPAPRAVPARTDGGAVPTGDLTVVLELDRTELARTVYRLNHEETQRVGARLAGGAA